MEEKGTQVLPITYEDVKEYSDNLFALLDDLEEIKKNDRPTTHQPTTNIRWKS